MASLLVRRSLQRERRQTFAAVGVTRRFCKQAWTDDPESHEELSAKFTTRAFLRSAFIRHSVARDTGSRNFLHHYEIQSMISETSSNHVWLAKRKSTGESVIVKEILKPTFGPHQNLHLEFEALKVADHPNVVRLHEVFEDNNSFCIIMEHCSGGDLMMRMAEVFGTDSVRMRGTTFGSAELKSIMRQILRAVSYCHQKNIVHRDIKLHHFAFVNSEPDAPLKLIGFGVTDMAPVVDGWENVLTRQVGSEGYMAPEIMKGQPYGPKADIWSVGAVMHVLVTGCEPQWNPEYEAYHFPAKDRWMDFSLSGEAFIRSMLNPDPSERPSASELLSSSFLEAFTIYDGKDWGGKFVLDHDTIQRIKNYSKRSRFERMARVSIAAFASLYSQESSNLSHIFCDADTDNNGEVDVAELAALLQRSDKGLTTEAIEAIISKVDTAKDSKVSYTEFMAAVSSEQLFGNPAGCRRVFSSLDSNGDGLISVQEIDEAMPGVFCRFELMELMSRVDADGNNQMDYGEFEKLLQGKSTKGSGEDASE